MTLDCIKLCMDCQARQSPRDNEGDPCAAHPEQPLSAARAVCLGADWSPSDRYLRWLAKKASAIALSEPREQGMADQIFRPGQKVTEFFLANGRQRIEFAVVDRMTKTKIVLDNGREWQIDGAGPWPKTSKSHRDVFGVKEMLAPYSPDHIAERASRSAEYARIDKREALLAEAAALIRNLDDVALAEEVARLRAQGGSAPLDEIEQLRKLLREGACLMGVHPWADRARTVLQHPSASAVAADKGGGMTNA